MSASKTGALPLVLVGAMAARAQAQAPPVTSDEFVAAVSGSDEYEIIWRGARR